jgi:hypothetical protein
MHTNVLTKVKLHSTQLCELSCRFCSSERKHTSVMVIVAVNIEHIMANLASNLFNGV